MLLLDAACAETREISFCIWPQDVHAFYSSPFPLPSSFARVSLCLHHITPGKNIELSDVPAEGLHAVDAALREADLFERDQPLEELPGRCGGHAQGALGGHAAHPCHRVPEGLFLGGVWCALLSVYNATW